MIKDSKGIEDFENCSGGGNGSGNGFGNGICWGGGNGAGDGDGNGKFLSFIFI